MKKLLLVLLLSANFISFSQDIIRKEITGKIIVEGKDIENIAIFNTSSNIGTVTNEKGEFIMAVTLNDILEIRALEYQNFDVRINEAILESKKINIFLIEEINKLEEIIVVSHKKLTGNLSADLKSAAKFNQKEDAIYFSIKNNEVFKNIETRINENPDRVIPSETRTLVDGLNIVNIVDQLLIPLFRSEVKDKEAAGIPEVPSKFIKYYLGSTFLVDNFNIPAHRVEEFIRYVEDDTFNFDLLNYGNELEFIELIQKRSKHFLNPKK
ncbi:MULTISPECIES: carboxypeptidase-like regulatory domain-containing protein [unclassified Polaribacter]|uniref:carboxypeptidase-like regulatory domain-containing protein n=1 Tax=unclassified Polaribacter TaxID=196858 RepID=UPI0011BF1CE9|nr:MULTISPECIES: carboxypeptidase-like regulatory domain-containing protein [unclassified Polaribacter]TXD47827.1 carboxypeptidase-like regulatory domain-containing protein [Polaribacter sp. IC063]TXD58258.1 carboxypeptidase-like regulatory domain-containing protein [Polaribacter sp. IC066]